MVRVNSCSSLFAWDTCWLRICGDGPHLDFDVDFCFVGNLTSCQLQECHLLTFSRIITGSRFGTNLDEFWITTPAQLILKSYLELIQLFVEFTFHRTHKLRKICFSPSQIVKAFRNGVEARSSCWHKLFNRSPVPRQRFFKILRSKHILFGYFRQVFKGKWAHSLCC